MHISKLNQGVVNVFFFPMLAEGCVLNFLLVHFCHFTVVLHEKWQLRGLTLFLWNAFLSFKINWFRELWKHTAWFWVWYSKISCFVLILMALIGTQARAFFAHFHFVYKWVCFALYHLRQSRPCYRFCKLLPTERRQVESVYVLCYPMLHGLQLPWIQICITFLKSLELNSWA